MSRLDAIQSGRARDRRARFARTVAAAATPLYRTGLALHQALYHTPLKRTCRLPRPVVSVGNLTTGGTGKTPMVAWVGRVMLQRGKRPAVLMRGYAAARSDGRSDEARELAGRLGENVPILAHPNRAAAARALLDREPGIDAFVLDDGFQHYRLDRDLDFVLIDASRPWGHGHLLPRGMLREPPAALRRADAVVVTRCDIVEASELQTLDREIQRHHGRLPLAHTRALWAGLRVGEQHHAVDWLATRRVAGACGVGNPHAFARMLHRYAGEVVDFTPLPDHHAPDRSEIENILTRARHSGAEALVTTEKDHVKWAEVLRPPAEDASSARPLPADVPPLVRPILELAFRDGEAALRDRLAGLLDA